MPDDISFYHDKEEDSAPALLTKDEEKSLAEDWEDIKNQREYRDKQTPKWNMAGQVYNQVQRGTNDPIANIYVGWVRSYIETGISQMNEGEPEFDFEPFGRSDHKRNLIWKAVVESTLQRSGYRSQQNITFTDSHIFGPGVMEVYQQSPYRTIRVPNGQGGYTEKVIPDFRRPRVGVRAISPFRCTRNPNVSDPNEVGSCSKEEYLSWDQFVQNYGRVYGPDGKPKFKNCDQVRKGSHVKITVYQNEIRDIYRIYALSYGSKNDGDAEEAPPGLGIPIFDRPLKIHDLRSGKGIERSEGLNIPGMCNLVFFPYNDKLDFNYQTHSVYGMGLPEHMEGFDILLQTFFNMTVDNWKMANTVVLNYKSNDGTTVPDFDANVYYGGEFVNGEVNPMPLGKSGVLDFQGMYDTLQRFAIPSTGINIDQITGDTSKTAFEFAQRIQANSLRTERRLKQWEEGPLKRLGTLALSAALSDLTTEQIEAIGEEQAEKVLAGIRGGRETKDDYVFRDGKPTDRKVRHYVDIKGFRENFDQTKSRKLDYDSTDNTLIEDSSEKIHRIPVVPEYVLPASYIESGVFFDTKVDSSRMIANRKIRDVQTLKQIMDVALQLSAASPELAQSIDFVKFFEEVLKYGAVDDKRILKTTDDDAQGEVKQLLEKTQQTLDAIQDPPTPNVQVPAVPPLGAPNAAQPGANAGGPISPPVALQGAAQGAL